MRSKKYGKAESKYMEKEKYICLQVEVTGIGVREIETNPVQDRKS